MKHSTAQHNTHTHTQYIFVLIDHLIPEIRAIFLCIKFHYINETRALSFRIYFSRLNATIYRIHTTKTAEV